MNFFKILTLLFFLFQNFFSRIAFCQEVQVVFPKNYFSVGYFEQKTLNGDISRPPRPMMWTAAQKSNFGGVFMYERLIFHTQKIYSLTLGFDYGNWFAKFDSIQSFSLFFKNRFWIYHNKFLTPYIVHSIAGLTLLSQSHFSTKDLGSRFLFQDFLGIGAALGNEKNLFVEISFWHYSNGNIFPVNPGFDVPIVLSVGLGF